MIFLIVFIFFIVACAPKVEEKLKGINYIDITVVENKVGISYYSENPLKEQGKEEKVKETDIRCSKGEPYVGVWVWNAYGLKRRFDEFREFVRRYKVKRVYLQISKHVDDKLIKDLKNLGLEVFLLDGGREIKLNYPVEQIVKYDIEGFQVDIEPYLNWDFNLKRERYLSDYVKFLKEIRRKLKDKKFSVVIPFWFDKFRVKDKPLLHYVFKYADEVAVMAYRNNLKDALKLSREEIEYAKRYGKDIFIGLEFHRLKDEYHYVYKVGKYKLIPAGQYVVKGALLTFPKDELSNVINIECNGVKGFIIHSFEAF